MLVQNNRDTMMRWTVIIGIMCTSSLVARAELRLVATDTGVVMENEFVKIDLPKKRNYHPAVLTVKGQSNSSRMDGCAFAFWDDPAQEWRQSDNAYRSNVSLTTSLTPKEAWCQAVVKLPGSGRTDTLTVRATVFAGTSAVKLDFRTDRPTDRLRYVGLKVGSKTFTKATWAGRRKTETATLIKNKPILYGLRNWVALTHKQPGGAREGVVLFLNKPFGCRLPSLNPYLFHVSSARKSHASVVVVPFSGSPEKAAAENIGRWGRPEGITANQVPLRKSPGPDYAFTRADKDQGFVAFVVKPFDVILPQTMPAACEVGRTMNVHACPGEYEPATFAMHALKDLSNVTVACSALTSNDRTIPAENLDVHIVKVWQQAGYQFDDISIGEQQVPELLLKDDRVTIKGQKTPIRLDGPIRTDLAAGQTKQFWITVKIPERQAAGAYRGSVTFRAASNVSTIVLIEVNVLPFALADSRKKAGIWFVAERRSDMKETVSPKAYLQQLINARQHGLDFVTIRARGTRAGKEVVALHAQTGFKGEELTIISGWMPSSVADWSSLREQAENLAKNVAGYRNVYFGGPDEPNSPKKIARAIKVNKKLRAAGAKTFTNIKPEYALQLGDLLDIPCVPRACFFGNPIYPGARETTRERDAALAKLVAEKREVWYYWNCTLEDPRISRLLFGFLLMKSRATGAMPWQYYNAGVDDPYDDWSSGKTWRAGQIVYPSLHGPIDTLQWEGAREGIDDARYITTLEKMIAKAAASPKLSNKVAAARKVLQRTLDRVDMRIHDSLQKLNADDIQRLRMDLIRACLDLHNP